jgi:hypothetical protein
VSHPILQGFYVAHVILQIARRKRVPEFVEEEIGTVRPLRALVAVLRNTLPAIHFRVEGDALQFEFVPLVWPARFVRKDQRVRVRLL